MCHNEPWLSALDKQMRLQFAPRQSKADAVSQFWRQSISYSWSSSIEASVAETVMVPWIDTGSVTGRSQPTLSAVNDKLNVVRQVLRSLPRHQTAEFEVDSLAHRNPVQLAQDRRDVVASAGPRHEPGSSVLDQYQAQRHLAMNGCH